MSSQTNEQDWKETIFLPQTDFSMRGDLALREPETVSRWRDTGLYARMQERRADQPTFVFHDGPPYANGDIHHGHALNKILKDFVVKYRNVKGFRAPFVPGWDCHGLPIEQKVDELLGKAKQGMSVVEFRNECRRYAQKHIEIQCDSFRRLLVLADWENPYRTMDSSYVGSILKQIGAFMDGGYVYKGKKPVHWSWAAVTALAEAEVEYAPYLAPSVYVPFALPNPPAFLVDAAAGRAVDVVIWTTTPWTLPSNVAIALHPDLEYELVALSPTQAVVVASGLRDATFKACGITSFDVLATFVGADLVGTTVEDWPRLAARHPFLDRDSLLVAATYVTLEQGTGCVHTAPGHGADDFTTGLKYGLPVLAPVDKYGKYTSEVPDYEGQHVFKANPLIQQRLFEIGRLLNKPTDTYSVERYPHCWRTKKPLIFRATEQWFIRVDHDNLRQRALTAIGQTRWVPSWGENRIRAMVEGRPDWCISRQRAWGVPIPAFHCRACHHDIVDGQIARHVAAMAFDGRPDEWFTQPNEALVPADYHCPNCGSDASQWDKVEDILDVWFDSGVSWAAVLRDREGLAPQADLYLEGSDQHRGWFQTSLLASLGTQEIPPFKTVLTHGFLVDDQGRKYSKSNPRYEPLSKMLEEYGAEVLRLWVSMVDYRTDIVLAPELLKQAGGTYRKIRNTIRYMLGCLSDMNPDAPMTLTDLDYWALEEVSVLQRRVDAAYQNYDFAAVQTALFDFCNDTMSAIYLDALKDRLYCESLDDPRRRGSQFVIGQALRALVVMASPILSFTSDEAWSHMPLHLTDGAESVFLADWPQELTSSTGHASHALVTQLLQLRTRVAALIEARRPKKKGERVDGQIGSSQEAIVTFTGSAAALEPLRKVQPALLEFLIVSDIEFRVGDTTDASGLDIEVTLASTARCERCWNHRESVGQHVRFKTLCHRCVAVVERAGF